MTYVDIYTDIYGDDPFAAYAYGFENVGAAPIATQEANEWGYHNVGLEYIQTREGNSFGYENVGAEELVLPILDRIERWGMLIEGRRVAPVTDTRLDGHSYGYENVEVEPVAGLLVQLDAAQITGKSDGDTVTTWLDSSGLSNHADAEGDTPVYKTNIINGLPVVRFVNGSYSINPSPIITSPGTVFIVLKTTLDPNPASNMGLWRLGTSGDSTHVPYPDGIIYDDAGTNLRRQIGNPAAALTSPRIYCVRVDTNTYKAYLDGTLIYADTSGFGVGWAWPDWTIGKNFQLQPWVGDIGEFIFYNSALSDPDRITVESYLKNKWGIV